jgi:uncharacterized OsmC-like protein
MVKSTAVYQGQKHCELTHVSSGTNIATDAPKDNAGKGESFSPTDLLGAALTSCALTTMAIIAEREGIPFSGGSAEVEKEMTDNPRRIGALHARFTLPASLKPEHRKRMEEIAKTCPVHRSLSSEMRIPMVFSYE